MKTLRDLSFTNTLADRLLAIYPQARLVGAGAGKKGLLLYFEINQEKYKLEITQLDKND